MSAGKTSHRSLLLFASVYHAKILILNLYPYPRVRFKDFAEASNCKEKVLADLNFRVDDYSVRLATLRIEVSVTYKHQGATIAVPKVQGTTFLVDRDLGFFLTSKHVLLGDKAWDLAELATSDFIDFESAMEGFLTNAVIEGFPDDWNRGISLRLGRFR